MTLSDANRSKVTSQIGYCVITEIPSVFGNLQGSHKVYVPSREETRILAYKSRVISRADLEALSTNFQSPKLERTNVPNMKSQTQKKLSQTETEAMLNFVFRACLKLQVAIATDVADSDSSSFSFYSPRFYKADLIEI